MTRKDVEQWCSTHDPPGGAFRVPSTGADSPSYYCCDCVKSWPTADLMEFRDLGPDPFTIVCTEDLACANARCGAPLKGRVVAILDRL
jgi:hypothetical protein